MADSFVNILNVLDVAKFLSSLTHYPIKPEIIDDADDFISELKTALDNFLNPSNDKNPERISHPLLFDKHLFELLNVTKNIYDILTDDGKDAVKKYLENKNAKNSTT